MLKSSNSSVPIISKQRIAIPRRNRVLREEFSEHSAQLATVQSPLGADVAMPAGAGRLEHPDVRLCSVLDVHVRLRLVDVILGLAGEVLEYVQGAGVHAWLHQLAEHHHRDDHRQVQPPRPRRLPRALLCDRLRVAVPVLRIPTAVRSCDSFFYLVAGAFNFGGEEKIRS